MHSDNCVRTPNRLVNGHSRPIGLLACMMLIVLGIDSSVLAEPPAPQASPVRPTVTAVLTDGTSVTGTLKSFVDGVYTVKAGGKTKSFTTADVQSIQFQPKPSGRPTPQGGNEGLAELISKLRKQADHRGPSRGRVDPALIEQLAAVGPAAIEPLLAETKTNTSLRGPVSLAFKEMGPTVIPRLIEAVRKDTSSSTIHTVAYALREFGHASLPVIREVLADEDSGMRLLGMTALRRREALTRAEADAFEELLIAAFDDTSPKVRSLAPETFGRLCPTSKRLVPTLIDALANQENEGVRRGTISALSLAGRNMAAGSEEMVQIVEALSTALLEDTAMGIRLGAARALGALGTKAQSAAPALMAATNDQAERVGESARAALHDIGAALVVALREADVTDANVVALIRQLGGKDREAAMRAARELVELGPANLAAVMVAIRVNERNRYWNIVAAMIGAWGEGVSEALDAYAKDESPIVRRTVAAAWGHMETYRLPAALAALLHDSDPAVVSAAVDSLVTLSERPIPTLRKNIVPLLIEVLADKDVPEQDRGKVVGVLARVGLKHPEATEALIKAMTEDKSNRFRGTVARGLGRLGRQLRPGSKELDRIVQALADAIENESMPDTRRGVIDALGYMESRSEAALPVLAQAANDSYDAVAQAARKAVTKIEAAVKTRDAPPNEVAEAPKEQPAPATVFAERDNSRDVRGRDGWYIYSRRDAATGRVVELIVSNSQPAIVSRKGDGERVTFRPGGKGGRSFSGNTGLVILRQEDGAMRMTLVGLPVLSVDPVLAYQKALQATPSLSLRDFIATSKVLAPIGSLRSFFEFE
ncbi:hypothetical protein LCGC14_0161830 [marine sediment metagenome]|uniref:HEAT repeat domain-containing protein n=1 Tax=marine sediment metagenome TaxID=412755 RepID=A0A0F9XX11_9ZZZZ|nr:HEAT repeat domain-containing protein [Phycisphaerae bacterium]HDZ45054.1 HEAT repeat domain-containing protein [Phycisphaerae bacterium]